MSELVDLQSHFNLDRNKGASVAPIMASDLGNASILDPPPVSHLEPRAPLKKANRKGGLPEAKRKGRAKRQNKDAEELLASMQRLDLTTECTVPVGTGLVLDERMTEFYCPWDESFPECPERLVAIQDKLLQCGLLERCVSVLAQEISEEEILLAHSQEYLALMKSTETMSEADLRSLSDTYDSVYLHPNSYHSACLAAGSILQLVKKVLSGELRNGLAVVRPPGHHAQHNKMDGYCMFNSVGIAAQYSRQKLGIERVLIVDWDVHHGQGTQYLFEDNPSVLYFSIHRYEGGNFWPHLLESDCHAVGRGRGEGYNINVPWNQIGMRDADYLSAFLHILLPVALEFQPQLVLVAAGFDSVIGDPKGEMSTTPGCFAHLTHLLMLLSGGKLVLSLEGGYNLQSLAEGTCTVLKALLGDPCPLLESPLTPCSSALHSVSQTLAVHSKYWKNLRRISADVPQENGGELSEALQPASPPSVSEILSKSAAELMQPLPPSRTGLVYDEKMTEHYNMWDSQHPELPQRVSRIFQRHGELRLTERCRRLPARLASEEELRMCHSLAYVETVKSTATMKPRDLHRQGDQYNSIYICTSSYECARLAAGSAFSAVEAVLSQEVQNAVAIVRPPGHHAESDTACGFCFFNSVALAARYAQRLAGRPMRVMILDWDVHHGNGTQHMFENDPSVLYVSIHRYDNGTFFPTSDDANYDRVGLGPGKGFTLNVPWNCPRMGDPEYLAAFHQIVMPVGYEVASKKTADVPVDQPKKASKKASSERARSPEPRKKLSKRRHSLEEEVSKTEEPAVKKSRVRPEKAKHRLELKTEPSLPARSKSPSLVPGPSSVLSIPPPLKVVSPPLQALASESESEGEIRDDIPLLVAEQAPALPKDSANLGTEANEALLDPETERILRENPDVIFDSLTGRFLQHVDPRNLASRSAALQLHSSHEGLHHHLLGPCSNVRATTLQSGGCHDPVLLRRHLCRDTYR
ncbi:hypothetical protein JD844_010479 [Phrynosoma platyrhinos]|uniref:Histone deacetylase domain-containing protein n=1 Tax=Phrynosoma platyrhinos TaxID=52577 RepID=A0ABQ7THE8_PHRPL|nr:hypothetical protein JD844_010479 [Phrynosoma platyrhinos]